MKKISEEKRKEIILGLKTGYSLSYLAHKYSISRYTVVNIKNKTKLLLMKNKGGRPRKMSERTENKILRGFKNKSIKTVREGCQEFKNLKHENVTPQTIRNLLRTKGMKCVKKIKKTITK